MLAFTGVLFLVCLVAGDQVININQDVENELNQRNEKLTKDGKALAPIAPIVLEDGKVVFSNGVAVGVDTLQRTKDCTMKVSSDNKTSSFELHVGYRFLVLSFGSIQKDGLEFSGVFSIGKSSAHVSFTVVKEPQCIVRLGVYEIEELADVTLVSSIDPELHDESKYFNQTVRPAINVYLSDEMAGQIERLLYGNFCLHDNHVNGNLAEILNSLAL